MARASRRAGPLSSRHPHVRRVERFIARHALIRPADLVIAAVSGGADSVLLVHALHALSPSLGFQLEIAHFNHRWRGAESDADAMSASELGRDIGVPVHMGTARAHRPRAGSPEALAREARYRFLARVAHERSSTVVATGHTLDDQLETYLIGWLRGSGPAGASLMEPNAAVPTPRSGGVRLVRPLLELSRGEVRDALAAAGITWRDDRTNDDPHFLRARVRNELLPLLDSIAPGARRTILRAASLAREAATYVRSRASHVSAATFKSEAGELVAARTAFLEIDPALRAAVLLDVVSRVVGAAQDVEAAHLEAAVGLVVRGTGGKRTPLGPEAELALARGSVVVRRRSEAAAQAR